MKLAPHSAVSLEDYAAAYSNRLRARTFGHVPMVIGSTVVFTATVGVADAVMFVIGLLAVEVLLISASVGVGRWREDRRRLAGGSPSWSSTASRSVLRRRTSHGDVDSREMGEVRGRLVLTPDGFCWKTKADAKNPRMHRASIVWPTDIQIEVRRVWGPAQPGLVRLSTSSGIDDIITVWRAKDLARCFHAGGVVIN